jgi:hypothetical protein
MGFAGSTHPTVHRAERHGDPQLASDRWPAPERVFERTVAAGAFSASACASLLVFVGAVRLCQRRLSSGGSMSEGGANNPSRQQSSGRSATVRQWLFLLFAGIGAVIATLTYLNTKEPSGTSGPFPSTGSLVRITYPSANQIVGQFETARGLSLFPNVSNFIVITAQETGVHYLQHDEIQADVSGAWHHPVQFGEESSCGKTFDIQIVGASLNLNQIFTDGVITKRQSGWLYSPPVTVMRERCT